MNNHWFLNKLNNTLAKITNPYITESINPDDFIQFMNAIMTSTNQERINQALEKANTLDPDQLTTIIAQTTQAAPLNNITGLHNAIKQQRSRITTIINIAKKLFNDTDITTVFNKLSPLPPELDPERLISLQRFGDGNMPIEDTDEDGNPLVATWEAEGYSHKAYEWTDKPGSGYVEFANGAKSEQTEYGPGHPLEKIINAYLDAIRLKSEEEYDEAGDYYYQGDDGGGH